MLSGSGMAFSVELYKECLANTEFSGAGFDKLLQKKILDRKLKIAFAEDARIFDEKTSQPKQLLKQRARWNNTWFRFFKSGYQLMRAGLKNLDLNQLLFGFVLVRPPLFILIIICTGILLVNCFISLTATIVWLFLFLLFITGAIIALLKSGTDKRIYRSILYIPKFMILQVFTLGKVSSANQYSVATEHSFNKNIEDVTSPGE
jgi:cellulose synthase/poly-beta-1,6-N-acetylglucosamine synthase-like glycosyltransferase